MPYDQMQRYNRQQAKEVVKSAEQLEGKPSSTRRSNKSQPAVSRASATSESMAKTLNNRSSVHHNIITGEPNVHSQSIVPGLLDKQVCNRKLGIT